MRLVQLSLFLSITYRETRGCAWMPPFEDKWFKLNDM